jgi:hypothetical protein
VRQNTRRDEGGIVLGWLTRIVVILAIVGVIGFDAVSVGAAHVSGQDDANSAASAAAADWQISHQIQTAYNAAVEAVSGKDETVVAKSFRINNDGSVHLQLLTHATTLVMYRIGPLHKYTSISVTGSATPPVQ